MNFGVTLIKTIKLLPFKAKVALLLCIALAAFDILAGFIELHFGHQENHDIPWTWKETNVDVPADIHTDLKINTDLEKELNKKDAEIKGTTDISRSVKINSENYNGRHKDNLTIQVKIVHQASRSSTPVI